VEGAVAGTVDENVGRHQRASLPCELKPVIGGHGALPSAVSLSIFKPARQTVLIALCGPRPASWT
jgi:hypothetical protein